MKIVIGSDHAGFIRKEEIKEYLLSKNIEVFDVGTDSTESVDYPIFGFAARDKYVETNADYLIAFCGSGIGIGVAINKKGGKCIVIKSVTSVRKAKAQGIKEFSIGERTTTIGEAKILIDEILK